MARTIEDTCLNVAGRIGAILLAFLVTSIAVHGQDQLSEPPPAATPLPPVTKECQGPPETMAAAIPLPNSTTALQQRRKFTILAMGASPSAGMGPATGGYQALIEQMLENAIKGLDVDVINRGFSGELVRDAQERLKIQVALNQPDLVLWQVGTNDALVHTPVETFEQTVTDTIRWVKEHNVDIVLVGLHYARQMAGDPHYQAIRASVRRIAEREKVMRIGYYEAMETMMRARSMAAPPQPDEFSLTESGYLCLAQYVARTITLGLFAKRSRP